jgi:cbb3-type cytochrome oxidase cytochrome c subunit
LSIASAFAGAVAWGLIVTGPDTANAGAAQLFDPAKQELQQPSLNLNNSFSPSLRTRAS